MRLLFCLVFLCLFFLGCDFLTPELNQWESYNETEELIANANHPIKRMRYKRIQSQHSDRNSLFIPFREPLLSFDQSDHDRLKPYIVEQDIPSIQKHINSGRLTYEQLTLFYIYRIYKYELDQEAYLNAIITLNPNVLKEARKLDQQVKNGITHPLNGMPILLKDNIDAVQMATTAGAAAMRQNFPEENAFIVKQLKSKGALILGKVNMSEWAYYFCQGCPVGYSAGGGQTLNPYGRKIFETGGSSSGSGVAVAANYAVAAIGSETSGSILSPSGKNSVVGLKPTIGAVSRSGIVPISSSMDTAGPMTKFVIDNIIVMNAILGYDGNDSFSYDSNPIDVSFVKKSKIENYSLGYYSNYYKNDSLYKENIDLLKSFGAKMIEIKQSNIPLTNFRKLLDEDMRVDLVKYLKDYGNEDLLVSDIKTIINYNSLDSVVRSPYGQGIFRSIIEDTLSFSDFKSLKNELSKNGNKFFDSALDKFNIDAVVSINNYHAAYAAVAHNPCLTVPMGFRTNNQPAGLTFITKSKSEQKLYEIGYSYEQISKKRKAPENSKN